MSNYLVVRHAGNWKGAPFVETRAGQQSPNISYDTDRGGFPLEKNFVASPAKVPPVRGKMFSAPIAVGCSGCGGTCGKGPQATGLFDNQTLGVVLTGFLLVGAFMLMGSGGRARR
jgi:hypothetical protein